MKVTSVHTWSGGKYAYGQRLFIQWKHSARYGLPFQGCFLQEGDDGFTSGLHFLWGIEIHWQMNSVTFASIKQ